MINELEPANYGPYFNGKSHFALIVISRKRSKARRSLLRNFSQIPRGGKRTPTGPLDALGRALQILFHSFKEQLGPQPPKTIFSLQCERDFPKTNRPSYSRSFVPWHHLSKLSYVVLYCTTTTQRISVLAWYVACKRYMIVLMIIVAKSTVI